MKWGHYILSAVSLISLTQVSIIAYAQDKVGYQTVQSKRRDILLPPAKDPKSATGIDPDLLAEEYALMNRVKALSSVPTTAINENERIAGVVQKGPTNGTLKPVTPVATTGEQKARANIKIIGGAIEPSIVPESAKNIDNETEAVLQTANRMRELNSAKVETERKLTEAQKRINELTNELKSTRNRLLVAETEVDRLSKILSSQHDISLSQLRPQATSRTQKLVQSARESNSPPAAIAQKPAAAEVSDMPIATVISDKAYLRTGPGKDNSPLMSVKKGTRLAVEVRQGDWYRVTAPTGARAWVAADVVAFGDNSISEGESSKDLEKVRGYDPAVEDKAFQFIRGNSR